MKKISIVIILIAGLFTLISCEKTEKGPVIASNITNPDLTAPTGGVIFTITEPTENDTMTIFKWDPADFGFQAGVKYTLQFTITGNFTGATDIGTTTKTSLAVLNSKVNLAMLIQGALPGAGRDVYFRIKADINPKIPSVYSDTVSVNVTPFEKIIVYPLLWVPGDPNGWNHANAKTIASVKSDNKYEGYVNFPAAGNFKFTSVAGWSGTNYGDGGAGLLSTDGGAGNLSVPSAGYYKLNANTALLTWSATGTAWGLIGSATPDGWNSDQNLTYDAGTDVWTITLNLVVGEIKFRANDGWDINLGDTGGDFKVEYGGSNIPIAAAGNYTIKLYLGIPVYRYQITKN